MDRVLSLEDALGEVAGHARGVVAAGATEMISLDEAAGRVLAQEVRAPRDQPAFDRATRDGFAVRAAELGGPIRVIGQVRAGERWVGAALGDGEAVEIMTGAPLPDGADAVLMVEHATVDGTSLTSARSLRVGENIVRRGQEAGVGDVLLAPGQVLDAGAIAVAANCGLAELSVFAKPRVGILATGDELVEVGGGELEEWQIYNSNGHALAALVEAAGGVAQRLPIARDTREDLERLIEEGRQFDLLLLSGGVSMGKYDFVEQVLAERGAEFFFTGVKIQPGKPVVFGRMPKAASLKGSESEGLRAWTYFFGLPGNPVSTEVCFHLFAAMMVRALAGRTEVAPQFVAAMAAGEFAGKVGLVRLLPARVESTFRETTVRPVTWQGSGDTAANARANCYCVVEEQGVAQGDLVPVLLR